MQMNDKLYTIKASEKDAPKIKFENNSEQKGFDSVSSIGNKNLVISLNNQSNFPKAYQSFCKIPASTKSMNLNMFETMSSSKRKTSSKAKQRGHKKTYSKKPDIMSKNIANNLSAKSKRLEDFSSPYKLNKKSKDFLSQVTLSANEYSNYLRSKHVNTILNSYSIESSGSRTKQRTMAYPTAIKPVTFVKPSAAKIIPLSKFKSSQRKKKTRSKTEKNVVFMMPGQHISNQYIHFGK
jgi:hypothetical protein